MAAALPLGKLGGLLVKTLAKPMSKRIKHEFSRYEFTQGVLVYIGQSSHMLTSRMTIWSAGYKVRSITPLDREEAMSTGAEFVGEAFVFFVAGSIVVYEYNRGKEKEAAKDAKRTKELRDDQDRLQEKLNALDARLVALEKVVKTNSKSIFNLGGARYVEPDEVVVPIDDRPMEAKIKEKRKKELMHDNHVTSDAPSESKTAIGGGGKDEGFILSRVKLCGSNNPSDEEAPSPPVNAPTDQNEVIDAKSVNTLKDNVTISPKDWRRWWPF